MFEKVSQSLKYDSNIFGHHGRSLYPARTACGVIILSVEVITHKIDELNILYGPQIFYLCEMMHSLDVSTVFRSKHNAVLQRQTFPVIYFTHNFGAT